MKLKTEVGGGGGGVKNDTIRNWTSCEIVKYKSRL